VEIAIDKGEGLEVRGDGAIGKSDGGGDGLGWV
jgi:hypothetical protein